MILNSFREQMKVGPSREEEREEWSRRESNTEPGQIRRALWVGLVVLISARMKCTPGKRNCFYGDWVKAVSQLICKVHSLFQI